MAGYSGTPLAQKLGIKPESRVLAIDAPKDCPFATVTKAPADIVHLFVRTLADLDRQLPRARKAMATDGAIWVSWYKKAAKIPTDLVDVKVCAVDDKWSGLKLVVRKALR